MKVNFHSSFFKSLKKIRRHETWWYKTYEFFKYDIWRFLRNLKSFRKELWNFYPWDFVYNLKMLKRSLELTADNIEKNGNEVPESKNKKIAKMRRAIELIDNISEDNFIERAEKSLNTKVNHGFWPERISKVEGTDLYEVKEEPEDIRKTNSDIFELADKIEEEEWKELWEIVHGKRESFVPSDSNDYEKTRREHDEWFDGSGMKTWWD